MLVCVLFASVFGSNMTYESICTGGSPRQLSILSWANHRTALTAWRVHCHWPALQWQCVHVDVCMCVCVCVIRRVCRQQHRWPLTHSQPFQTPSISPQLHCPSLGYIWKLMLSKLLFFYSLQKNMKRNRWGAHFLLLAAFYCRLFT